MARSQGVLRFAAERREEPPRERLEIGVVGTSRFGGRMQPEEYSPDWGIPSRYDKVRRMLNDADVGSAIDQITMPLEASAWEVVPGDESDAARESAEIIADDLLWSPNVYTWGYVLDHALQAVAWGSMLFEPVWAIGEKVRLEKLAPRMPYSIREHFVDRAGLLTEVEQYVSGDDAGIIRIPASKLVVIVYRQKGSDYTGSSLLRRAYRNWWMMTQLEDVDGIAAEKHGMGVDVATYDPEAIKGDQLTDLKSALRVLHAHQMQNLTVPNSVDYKILAPSGTVHDTMQSVKHHQQKVFRALLADFLGMGEGRLGSHGLSEDKTSMLLLKLKKLGQLIVESFNSQLLAPWHRWNYGETVPPPRLKHGRIDTRDLLAFVQAVAAGADAGVLTPDATVEAMVRDIGGLDPIGESEREAIQGERRKEAVRAGIPRPFRLSGTGTGTDLGPLSAVEGHCRFAAIEQGLDSAEDVIVEGLGEVAQEVVAHLVDEAERIFAGGAVTDLPGVVVPEPLVAAMAGAITAGLGDLYAEARVESARERTSQRAVRGGRVELAIKGLLPADEAAIDEHLGVRGRAVAERLAERFRTEWLTEVSRQAATGRLDAASVIDLLTGLSDETLRQDVRILTSEAVGLGRRADQDEHIDEATSAEYSARLDANTCPQCRALHGQRFVPGSPEYEMAYPPLDDLSRPEEFICDGRHQCRCLMLLEYPTQAPRG